MTGTGDILAALARAVDDFDAAGTQAAAAAGHADDVRERMLGHGWTGIADGMQELIDKLDDVRAAIERGKQTCADATGPLSENDPMTSPAEASRRLGATVAGVGEVTGAINDAADQLDDAETIVARVLDGGDPSTLLGMLDQIGHTLVSARRHGDDAKRLAETEIQEASTAGN